MTSDEMLRILGEYFGGGGGYINKLLGQVRGMEGTRGPVSGWGPPAAGGYMDKLIQELMGMQGTRGPVEGWAPELTEAFDYIDTLGAPSQGFTPQPGTEKWTPREEWTARRPEKMTSPWDTSSIKSELAGLRGEPKDYPGPVVPPGPPPPPSNIGQLYQPTEPWVVRQPPPSRPAYLTLEDRLSRRPASPLRGELDRLRSLEERLSRR